MNRLKLLIITAFFMIGCSASIHTTETEEQLPEIKNKIAAFKSDVTTNKIFGRLVKPDTIDISKKNKIITITLSKEFSYNALREDDVNKWYDFIKAYFGDEYKDYSYSLKSLGVDIKELVPNYYRKEIPKDYNRLPKLKLDPKNAVVNVDKPYITTNGLVGRNIVLWQSHGWYFNNELKRWEWERPRLFQSAEDKIPMSFVLPYLIPMLENSGASVFTPRERDFQVNEVIVDNDDASSGFSLSGKWNSVEKGFSLNGKTSLVFENPFELGTYVKSTDASATAKYTPNIPEEGYYPIYISYKSEENSSSKVNYVVNHLGGSTKFIVDQTIGGGSWIYLGRFKFDKGKHADSGSIIISLNAGDNKTFTADAIRFGAGKGIVEREGVKDDRPKYLQAARYWLQYAGMPVEVYNINKDKDDYKDDYQSRPEYANFVKGAPFGPNADRKIKGLGIPVDLSLAFHTDAGITTNDTVVGTLSIYSVADFDYKRIFPDGQSRLANRDLADIVQTEIVNDIKANFDPAWVRRDLREAQYGESQRQNMPAMLLELLSHQNFLEMKFVHDPNFRFAVSRAIYKGMVKFLAAQNGFEYKIQPLPVNHFSVEVNSNKNFLLNWQAQVDRSEQTAVPTQYVVYTRINDGGFDNGTLVTTNSYEFKNIKEGNIYSFKVTAVNGGGESFPSEILSACLTSKNAQPVLIVNGFDRLSAPASIDEPTFKGFMSHLDAGVQDKYDFTSVGLQNDFDPSHPWLTNDNPGHGASGAELETLISGGNTFDFPYVHGSALRANNVSFVSCSDETVENGSVVLNNYKFVDFIFGEEKTTPRQNERATNAFGKNYKIFTPALISKIEDYTLDGGNLFISGSYIASDLRNSVTKEDSSSAHFAKKILKAKLASEHAAKNGGVSASSKSSFSRSLNLTFNTEVKPEIYTVEAPNAIDPEKGAKSLLRYSENKYSAATGYKDKYGVVVFGFPFETIVSPQQRNQTMGEILRYLKVQ